jgi:hypothetical protein
MPPLIQHRYISVSNIYSPKIQGASNNKFLFLKINIVAFKWESLNPPLEKQSIHVRSVVGTYIHNSRMVKMKKSQEPMVVL